jgi:F-type H+-transporting ATPase subunit epsilon
MKSFRLRLCDATHSEEIADVVSFVGEDASGSFGLLAGHARFMTALVTGLARFRGADAAWHYVALPGGIAYFRADLLTIGTRRYLLDDDYERISGALRERLLAEERSLQQVKRSLRTMEEEILKRLWDMGRQGRM